MSGLIPDPWQALLSNTGRLFRLTFGQKGWCAAISRGVLVFWVGLGLCTWFGCATRVTHLKTGLGPSALAMDTRGLWLYVACEGTQTVQAWEIQKRRLRHETPVGAGPYRLYLDGDRERLMVLCPGQRKVQALQIPDLSRQRILHLSGSPGAWVSTSDGQQDVFCSPESDSVHPYAGNNPLPVVETGFNPVDLVYRSEANELWVALEQGRRLTVVRLDQGKKIHDVPVHDNPIRLLPSLMGDGLWVLCQGRDAVPRASMVQWVDVVYRRAGLGWQAGDDARDAALDPRGRFILVLGPSGLRQLNAATGVLERSWTVGRDPRAVVISPDGNRAYVASGHDSRVDGYWLKK